MPERMEFSNRSSNTKGKNVSIYLRAEDLETLALLEHALGKNRSETIQHILGVIRNWIKAIMKEKPDFIMPLIQEEIRKLMQK